ncbi:Chloramphenicol 3-O phosphotransferase [Streptomyces sp. RB5]|uniref:Chloramphenicol 3-O phosphotransferase n=1 Tax=Streptomyces smaragdinus TaxID=2585196 RepID=A0A7K0CAS2_9ACTN|nr:chloramphenicol phosphotransferase CPT [Streptomyces smaragdinus]MQY10539.1 Chloramphenicol 3-O phosphotransferase [Streptomyces smaragdinus]
MIILNGGSSSGKSGIVRCLQAVLPDPWLAFGCDSFVDALPANLQDADAGITIAPDGTVEVGEDFATLERAWTEGIVTMARAGARIIIDDVFLGGARSQQRWQKALGDVPTLWVAVHCAPDTAAAREIARGDRTRGMAAAQALTVHEGVTYDVKVDTTHTESLECARTIAAHVG